VKILGIHDGHNASAALLVDGEIIAAVQEERFNREKNWSGFPRRSIEWVLEASGVDSAELDAVAMDGHHMPNPRNREELLIEYRETGSTKTSLKRLAKRTPLKGMHASRRRAGRMKNVVGTGIPAERIRFVEHHDAHASAAYYGWGRHENPVLILTNDGAGDGFCASVSIGSRGRMERLTAVPESESIGNVYAVVTFLLGMIPLEHEYKLMGLAPYAPESGRDAVLAQFRSMMSFDAADGRRWRRTAGVPETYYSYEFMRQRLELKRFDWICAGLQAWTEEMLTKWASNCIRSTGIRKVCLGGGVFMNVKANKLIGEIPELEELFVFPSCSDETNAIGAAYWVEARGGTQGSHIPPLRDLYLGPSYGEEESARAIAQRQRADWTARRFEDVESEVAGLLARGEVVARFSGRAEFGARALGNRSILADAANPEVIRVINDMIKSRDFWMPFAPAILAERSGDYLVNPKDLDAPYMILSFDTTESVGDLRAAIHPYDLTVRPQVVHREAHPRFYEIIEKFEQLTGRGVILNTSFNLHGYPIVNSPDDALDVLEQSGLRNLALENWLITKA
jgi:carbamoyltransferase